ncbi:uncharacterized protein LOC141894241 isoform X3 [Acropora palmata]|uniref:uncharacterized protein LOC141894241 isoform X3 n=1 Tax=Acropora palmata TaxID=6131 RepID=UPI003DA15736
MSLMKHRRGGRGGNRGQRSHRAGSSPPPQSNSFVNIDDGVSNTNFRFNEAIVYHVTSNLGETARVVVRSGDIYEGILRAVSSKFDCVLGEAHLVAQKKPANGLIEDERILPNRDRLINNILIALKDIVIINITKTEEPDSAIDRFTDEAIAGSRHANGQLAERQLQKWVPQEAEPFLGGGLEDNTQMNGWAADEMFKTNQKKFGVTSTYSDALEEYTMPIPDGTREMELRAEQTAREIEQSCGHSRRQEVDSGCTEEEAFASVIRPKTTAQASRPTNSPPVTAIAERQEVAADKSSPCATEGSSTSTTATLSSATENKVSPDEDASQGSFVKSPAMSETSKVVQDLKDFSANFKLLNPRRTKDIPTEPETGEPAVASSKETPSSEKGNVDDSKTSKPPEDDILTTSKLNPLAKEFKFTPKSQKPTPSPQPAQYVSVLPAQPFSPTPVRPPAVPYSQPVMMFNPQQLNPMYRGKPPHNKSRGQSYAVRDQESPPFISAAAATGSPIIAPGGTYPPQVYQLPPIAYVQSTGGMATQPMVQQYVTVPAGHPPARFIAPVSSPGSGPPVPMSQAYQDGSAMPVYVAGNMSALPGAATSPGQPQPSPSQQGQFIFASPVPPLPGQPQGAGHHQAQVAPGPTQFPPQPVVYIPNANVSSSAASAVSYIPGTYPADRIQ